MKKIFFLLLTFILISCSPQVTLTPTATIPPPTETPIPTPTLNPYFVAVQNFISDLNENLTLLPDGSIENNGVPIPNLHVDQNGVINILFNNEHVVIETSQISFDAESGLTIEGYTLEENGEWVEAQETVKLDNGIVFTLGDKNADGISEVVEVNIDDDSLSEELKEILINQFDPGYVGFTPEEAKLYYDAESNTYWVGSADDMSNVIARMDEAQNRLIWDYDKMKDQNGEISFMSEGQVWEIRGDKPANMESAELYNNNLMRELTSGYLKISGLVSEGEHFSLLPVYVYDNSSNNAIIGFVFTNDKQKVYGSDFTNFTGTFLFLDKEGNVRGIDMENFDCEMRYWL